MNANELADLLISTKFQVDEDGTMIGVSHQAVDEAATMLLNQQSEIEALKAKLNYAKETIESIVWTDRKPFDDSGWASVSFSALAKGADCLRKIQEK